MVNRLRHSITDVFNTISERLRIDENTLILLIASIVGIIGGFGAVGFRTLIEFIQSITIGGHEDVLVSVTALPTYKKILLPVVGGLIIGIADAIGGMIFPGAMKSTISFVLFILILLFKQTGLFGSKN